MIYYRRAVPGHPGKFVIDRRLGTVPPANYEDPGPQSDVHLYPHNTKEKVVEAMYGDQRRDKTAILERCGYYSRMCSVEAALATVHCDSCGV